MKVISTIIGAALGAYIAGSGFFTNFTNKTNWQEGDRIMFITKYDAGFSAATGAIAGGGFGLIVGVIVDRYAAKQRVKTVRMYLLQLRESEALEQLDKEAIDLTLSNMTTHENLEPNARSNDAPRF